LLPLWPSFSPNFGTLKPLVTVPHIETTIFIYIPSVIEKVPSRGKVLDKLY
jgi:hypothetical protein